MVRRSNKRNKKGGDDNMQVNDTPINETMFDETPVSETPVPVTETPVPVTETPVDITTMDNEETEESKPSFRNRMTSAVSNARSWFGIGGKRHTKKKRSTYKKKKSATHHKKKKRSTHKKRRHTTRN
jgi:hypothetical protein